MYLEIRVIPNAKRFALSFKDGAWKAYVRERAEDNKANRELVATLSHALGVRVSIVKGLKSRNKVLDIEGNEHEVLERLRKIAQEA